jgi:hypothetical protein
VLLLGIVARQFAEKRRVRRDRGTPRKIRLEISILVREEVSTLPGFRIREMTHQRFDMSEHCECVPDERATLP